MTRPDGAPGSDRPPHRGGRIVSLGFPIMLFPTPAVGSRFPGPPPAARAPARSVAMQSPTADAGQGSEPKTL